MNTGEDETDRSEGEEAKTYALGENKKCLDCYVKAVNKNTEVFSTYDPDTILNSITNYFDT